MLQVSCDVSGMISGLNDLARQHVPYALARALTQTAQDIKQALPDALDQQLDKPTPFTKRGWFVRAAKKTNLVAVIGAMDRQAEYMAWQVNGGEQSPRRRVHRLPATVQLDAYGNLPRNTMSRLIAAAKGQQALSKAGGKRLGVDHRASLFYGQPGNQDSPAGIYQRDGQRLIPLVVFSEKKFHYRPRFHFRALADQVVADKLALNFSRALHAAMNG